MKLFGLHPSLDDRSYAQMFIASRISWQGRDGVCGKCLEPLHLRRDPGLVITWEPGSDVVADFVHFGRDCFIVTDRVKIALEKAGVTGFRVGAVTIVEPPKRAKSKWPIVPSPYEGPTLWDIYVDPDQLANIVPSESAVDHLGPCDVCGVVRYEPDVDADDLYFVIDRSTWKGGDFILPAEINGMLVTQRVADVIRSSELTNVRLVEEGRISD